MGWLPVDDLGRLLKRAQLFHNVRERRSIGSAHSDMLPASDAITVKNKQRRPSDAFLGVQYVVGSNVCPRRIRQDRIRKSQFRDRHACLFGRVGAQGHDLSAQGLNLFVTRLQLTELPLTVRSRVHPVEHDQDVLLTFELA